MASPSVRAAAIGVGLLLCAYWGVLYRPNLSAMLRVVDCSLKGQLICPSNRPIDELLATLRTETQPGEGVFFFNEDTAYVSQSLSVRSAAAAGRVGPAGREPGSQLPGGRFPGRAGGAECSAGERDDAK